MNLRFWTSLHYSVRRTEAELLEIGVLHLQFLYVPHVFEDAPVCCLSLGSWFLWIVRWLTQYELLQLLDPGDLFYSLLRDAAVLCIDQTCTRSESQQGLAPV